MFDVDFVFVFDDNFGNTTFCFPSRHSNKGKIESLMSFWPRYWLIWNLWISLIVGSNSDYSERKHLVVLGLMWNTRFTNLWNNIMKKELLKRFHDLFYPLLSIDIESSTTPCYERSKIWDSKIWMILMSECELTIVTYHWFTDLQINSFT